MAPSAVDQPINVQVPGVKSQLKKTPLESSGALDHFEHTDLTPVIGREYPTLNLVELVESPNADELIKELAYTISVRGVVFLRKQDNLTDDLQKHLIQRLGELSGKPASSGMHIHPILNTGAKVAGQPQEDKEISTINYDVFKNLFTTKTVDNTRSHKKQSSDLWHSDTQWENVPSDYASLRLTKVPPSGGDTIWASGYEMYDRISEPMQRLLETLKFTFHRADLNATAKANGASVYSEPRGSPENVGEEIIAVHPAIRTNPVTGWKSVYAAGVKVGYFNDVTTEESEMLLAFVNNILKDNHDLQVRFRWNHVNDIAIWDNRCTLHNPTYDFNGIGDRVGTRAVSCGERPYLDPASKSRREAAKEKGLAIGDWVKLT